MQWTLYRRSAIGAPEIYLTVFDRNVRSVSIHGTAFTKVGVAHSKWGTRSTMTGFCEEHSEANQFF